MLHVQLDKSLIMVLTSALTDLKVNNFSHDDDLLCFFN